LNENALLQSEALTSKPKYSKQSEPLHSQVMLEELSLAQGLAGILIYKTYARKAREAELNGSNALEFITAGFL
jgi:hypothetical protein